MEKELQHYIDIQKDIQNSIIGYIESESDIEEVFENLKQKINDYKIPNDRNAFVETIQTLAVISCNHQRTSTFFEKIEQIILQYRQEIQQFFTNQQIFKIFMKNKRILLFLIEEGIVDPSKIKVSHFIKKERQASFLNYFKNEFSKKKTNNYSEDFKNKRKIGENDQYICELIRNDSIDEFISYVNQNNIFLNTKIEPSIFETNSFLIDETPSLIEYAESFGSIQIFKYLSLNGINIDGDMLEYVVHGQSPEMFNILVQSDSKPKEEDFEIGFDEAVKCHHNDFANYILSNYLNGSDLDPYSLYYSALHYHNYVFFPKVNNLVIFYLCKYNYPKIVEIMLKKKCPSINDMEVSKSLYFNNISYKKYF